MSNYYPDSWIVIQVDTDDYRVFGSWKGSYLTGDSWRYNSGISEVEDTKDSYYIHGESGSVYQCDKRFYGVTSFYNSTVVEDIIKRQLEAGKDAKFLSNEDAIELLGKFIKE